MHHALTRLVLAVLVLALHAGAGVLVVDAGGGGDATDLPEAIALASEGDVLLVQPGTYSGFVIDGISLHVVADGGPVLVNGAVAIRDLAAGQLVAFDEIDVLPPFTNIYTQPPALTIGNCQGRVRLERCEFMAPSPAVWDFCEDPSWPPGADGLVVTNCDDVVLSSCLLEGGEGYGSTNPLCYDRGSDGGRGLLAQDATVSLHEVIARGADGRIDGQGGVGGHGVELAGASEVLAAGCVVEGGDGGDSTDFVGFPPAGDGGDGVFVGTGATLRVLGGIYSGGEEGTSCCWETSPGVGQLVEGTLVDYEGTSRRLLTSSPAREGEDLTVSINGEPGDQVSLLVGLLPAHLPLPKFSGALYLDPSTMLGPLPLVTLPESAVLVPLTIPELGPGLDVVPLELQLFVTDASGEVSVLSGPGQAVLLDAAF